MSNNVPHALAEGAHGIRRNHQVFLLIFHVCLYGLLDHGVLDDRLISAADTDLCWRDVSVSKAALPCVVAGDGGWKPTSRRLAFRNGRRVLAGHGLPTDTVVPLFVLW